MFSLSYFRMANAMEAANTVWDYLVMGHNLMPSDLILVCCSNDIRVADRAVELYREVHCAQFKRGPKIFRKGT